jgi:hypothetical protein
MRDATTPRSNATWGEQSLLVAEEVLDGIGAGELYDLVTELVPEAAANIHSVTNISVRLSIKQHIPGIVVVLTTLFPISQ